MNNYRMLLRSERITEKRVHKTGEQRRSLLEALRRRKWNFISNVNTGGRVEFGKSDPRWRISLVVLKNDPKSRLAVLALRLAPIRRNFSSTLLLYILVTSDRNVIKFVYIFTPFPPNEMTRAESFPPIGTCFFTVHKFRTSASKFFEANRYVTVPLFSVSRPY